MRRKLFKLFDRNLCNINAYRAIKVRRRPVPMFGSWLARVTAVTENIVKSLNSFGVQRIKLLDEYTTTGVLNAKSDKCDPLHSPRTHIRLLGRLNLMFFNRGKFF